MNKFWSALIALDVWFNVNVFRGQKETMSDRMGEQLLVNNHGCCNWRLHLCKLLSFLDPRKGNHCIESIEVVD